MIEAMLAAARKLEARARIAGLPDFSGELYLVGSAAAVAQLVERRRERGELSRADLMVALVAETVELRHEDAGRGEDGEDLRGVLEQLAALATAWAQELG